ncbi:MAG TPA: undecaprenyldiphospho-muramoylpentapeptide beta-N-acetylglucosaminyltransferase [Syntrophales bacterium]|nr:undecaprenyldiphospho-muramoylpentapeptide beta-N-acetylglucosaminyltransferase [Syntrophales bacterium]
MKVIIAGGGTGGHLFPGIAIAEEFLKRDRASDILFVGTKKGVEARVLPDLGFDLRTLDVEGIKGKGFVKIAGAIMKIPGSLIESCRLIRSFSPDIVIGVGGYASGPAVLAAHFMCIRTAIAEQNALPGITNRILGRFVDRIFLTFPDTGKWFPEKKTVHSGNPVRAAFFTATGKSEKKGGRFALLIFGGSQGARGINAAAVDALPFLAKIKDRLKIVHQTGSAGLDSISAAYRSHGMDAEVLPFIMDMAAAFGAADLLVCRAGATSIAEITASGKASILIPFPQAVDDHQTKNAEALVKAGAAFMIKEKDLNGRIFAEMIERFFSHPEKIREMEARSKNLGNMHAAAYIVDTCLELLTGRNL